MGGRRHPQFLGGWGGFASSRCPWAHGWRGLLGTVLRTGRVALLSPPPLLSPPAAGFEGFLPKTGCSCPAALSSAGAALALPTSSSTPGRSWAWSPPCPRPPRGAPRHPVSSPTPGGGGSKRPAPSPALPVSGGCEGFTPSPAASCPAFAPNPRDFKPFLPGFPPVSAAGPLPCSVTSRPPPPPRRRGTQGVNGPRPSRPPAAPPEGAGRRQRHFRERRGRRGTMSW